jgi:hypothetical protein
MTVEADAHIFACSQAVSHHVLEGDPANPSFQIFPVKLSLRILLKCMLFPSRRN